MPEKAGNSSRATGMETEGGTRPSDQGRQAVTEKEAAERLLNDISTSVPQTSDSRSSVRATVQSEAGLSAPILFTDKSGAGNVVSGRQITEDLQVRTGAGLERAPKQSWLVSNADGMASVWSKEQFLERFRPAPIEEQSPKEKYIKSMPIEARMFTAPTSWQNPDSPDGSPPEMAKAGDFLAMPKGQAPYVIPADYFRANYVQIPGLGEYARTTITQAQTMTKPGSVWSPSAGVTSGAPGDYLITRGDGTQEILSATKFSEQFSRAETAPETREPLNKPKATGPKFSMEAGGSLVGEEWQHGLIVYDQGKGTISISDNRTGTSKEYKEGRLIRESKTLSPAGQEKTSWRAYPYGDLDTVRALPSLDSYKDLLERRPELKRAQELADTMPPTHQIHTPEREALRQKVRDDVRAHLDEMRRTPAADGTGMALEQKRNLHIVLGLSGSGKSTVAEEIARRTHAHIADVDEIKRALPEWQGGTGAAATSVEGHLINNPLVYESIAAGDNLVVPVVGATTEHIEKLMQSAKDKGYEVHLSLVDVPPMEAMKRIVGRLEQGGLYVDPTYLASLGNRPVENFNHLVDTYFAKSDLIDSFHQINNLGRRPVLVAEGGRTHDITNSGLRPEFFAPAKLSTERSTTMPDNLEGKQPTDKRTENRPEFDATPGEKFKDAGKPPVRDVVDSGLVPKVELSHGNVADIQRETELRREIQSEIARAKGGAEVKFQIDTRNPVTQADGQKSTKTQADVLYEELASAYPDRNFNFKKTVKEVRTPLVGEALDGAQLSTKENRITTSKDVSLADGTVVPAGSKFEVGTVFDGRCVKSVDPSANVWAETPDGKHIAVAGAGATTAIPVDAISADQQSRGQTLSRFTGETNAETGAPFANHIIIRDANKSGPDGKPLLDAYSAGGPDFLKAYDPSSREGISLTKGKTENHLLLPENISVEAVTPWGAGTSTGKDGYYFMRSGFGDAQDATATNYAGETDPRSAAEIARIRKIQGMTEISDAERSLAQRTSTPSDSAPRQESAGAEQKGQSKEADRVAELRAISGRPLTNAERAELGAAIDKQLAAKGLTFDFNVEFYGSEKLGNSMQRSIAGGVAWLKDHPDVAEAIKKMDMTQYADFVYGKTAEGKALSEAIDPLGEHSGASFGVAVGQVYRANELGWDAYVDSAGKANASSLKPLSETQRALLSAYMTAEDVDVTKRGSINPRLSAAALDGAVSYYRKQHEQGLATQEQVATVERIAKRATDLGMEASVFRGFENTSGGRASSDAPAARTASLSARDGKTFESKLPSGEQIAQARTVIHSALVRSLEDAKVAPERVRDLADRLTSEDSATREAAKADLSKHYAGGEQALEHSMARHIERRGTAARELVGKVTEGRGLLASLAVVASFGAGLYVRQEWSAPRAQTPATFSK